MGVRDLSLGAIHSEVIYQAIADPSKSGSHYPVHAVRINHRSFSLPSVHVTFRVEHVFHDEFSAFLKSTEVSLGEMGLQRTSCLEPLLSSDAELMECCMRYVGKNDFRFEPVAADFIKRLATTLGTPSIRKPVRQVREIGATQTSGETIAAAKAVKVRLARGCAW